MMFFAQITFDEADETLISDILRATWHIGHKRNRGMGQIRCELVPDAILGEKTNDYIRIVSEVHIFLIPFFGWL